MIFRIILLSVFPGSEGMQSAPALFPPATDIMSGFLFHDLRIHRFLLSPVLSGFYPAFFPDGSVYPLLRQSDVESLPAEGLLPSKSLFPDERAYPRPNWHVPYSNCLHDRYSVPLYGLPMFPSCRNTISLLNIHCI